MRSFNITELVKARHLPQVRDLGSMGDGWLSISSITENSMVMDVEGSTRPVMLPRSKIEIDLEAVDEVRTPNGRTRLMGLLKEINHARKFGKSTDGSLIKLSPATINSSLVMTQALGIFVYNGPKVLYANDEQFESMAHVEVSLNIADYAQPYPAVYVMFPKAWRLHTLKEFGLDPVISPLGVLIYCRKTAEGNNFVFAYHKFQNILDDNFTIFHAGGFETIEEAISSFSDDNKTLRKAKDGHDKFCHISLRASLNLLLMMMNYKESIQQLPSARRPKNDRFCIADTQSFEIKQSIVLRAPSPPPIHGEAIGEPGEPKFIEKSPHWRRGHWRMQPCGVGNTQRRRTLIRPMLIRADRMIGEKSNTRVEYQL